MGAGQHHHPHARALHNGPDPHPGGGAIEQLTVTDSIIQAIPTGRRDKGLRPANRVGTVSLARCTVLGHAQSTGWTPANASSMRSRSPRTLSTAASASAHWRKGALCTPFTVGSVPPSGPIFMSRRFGDLAIGLVRLADNAIIAPLSGDTIRAGPKRFGDGRLQGEGVTLKKRGLGTEVRRIRATRSLSGVDDAD